MNMFSPSASMHTMTSDDFSQFVVTTMTLVRPLRVSAYSFLSCICYIYMHVLRVDIGLQFVKQPYPTYLPDVISLNQAESLPRAFSRFHLKMDSLSFS